MASLSACVGASRRIVGAMARSHVRVAAAVRGAEQAAGVMSAAAPGRRLLHAGAGAWQLRRTREVRPFEIQVEDVDGEIDEWTVGDVSDVEDLNAADDPLEILEHPGLLSLHDTPEEAAADVLLFRDHITSAPRVKLPPSLVSRVPDDNEQLLDVAHLLDQNPSLNYQARERIFNDIARFMKDGEFDDPAPFPPDASTGKWMHLVNTDVQYRYRMAGLYSDSEGEEDDFAVEGDDEEGGPAQAGAAAEQA